MVKLNEEWDQYIKDHYFDNYDIIFKDYEKEIKEFFKIPTKKYLGEWMDEWLYLSPVLLDIGFRINLTLEPEKKRIIIEKKLD